MVTSVATELLRQAAWTGIVYGVLIAAFAWLLGGHRWAIGARRQIGRATETTGVAIGLAVLFVLLMLWWSPGRSFDRWLTALLFVVLTISAVATLLVTVARERREQLDSV